jgi:hypothetical protein
MKAIASSLVVAMIALVPAANAGPPKTTTVTSFSVGARGSVTAMLFSGPVSTRSTLAQIRAPRRVHARSCEETSTAVEFLAVAQQMGLTSGATVAPDPKLSTRGERVYLYQPDSRQSYSSGARSFALRLVELGLARVNKERGSFRARLLRTQRRATKAHRGLWRRC